MGNFQDVFLIILSLFSNLKLMSDFYFIYKKFLVYNKLEIFKNCKEVKHIIMIVAIIYIFFILYDIYLITVENYFQKILSPPEKIHSPLPFYSLHPKNRCLLPMPSKVQDNNCWQRMNLYLFFSIRAFFHRQH